MGQRPSLLEANSGFKARSALLLANTQTHTWHVSSHSFRLHCAVAMVTADGGEFCCNCNCSVVICCAWPVSILSSWWLFSDALFHCQNVLKTIHHPPSPCSHSKHQTQFFTLASAALPSRLFYRGCWSNVLILPSQYGRVTVVPGGVCSCSVLRWPLEPRWA